jgi:hypothetical protein
MNPSDPASLQNLNDIVLPAAISWWPLASGWYVLISLLLTAFIWFTFRSIRRWISNRYRREALHELHRLVQSIKANENRDENLRQIPVVLKRAALSAYPRNQVASLSGSDWYRFLNSTLSKPEFTNSISSTLDALSYSSGELDGVDSNAVFESTNACKYWLQHHRDPITEAGET